MSVPKLRFPEFRGTDEWEQKNFDDLYTCKITNSFSRNDLNYKCGIVKNIHYGDIHSKFSTLFDVKNENVPYINKDIDLSRIKLDNYCIEGDMVFADASEDLDDIGKSIEIINLNDQKVLSGLHTILARQKDRNLSVGFGGHLFKSNKIRTQIQRESQGTKVLGISIGRLSKLKINFPTSKLEQQKIATCLSLLDEVISAENSKLDTLKDHKQGLMQQLFPSEGESVPRVRFSEFEGVWEEKRIGECIQEYCNNSTYQDEFEVLTSSRNGLIRQKDYYGNNRLTERENIGFNIIPPNHITFRSRSDDRLFFFNENKLGITGIISTYYPVFQIKNGSNGFFIELFSRYANDIGKYSVGTSQTVLSLNALRKIKLPIPGAKEQQKIAACLSSLDDLITAQAAYIATLKLQKQGLMQQLFPSSDEVAA